MSRLADAIRAFNRACITLLLILIYLPLVGLARLFLLTQEKRTGWQDGSRPTPDSFRSPY